VLRDGRGQLARLVYVPSYTVRLMPLDREPVEVEERTRVSSVSFEPVTARRRLRRFLQIQGQDRVYFKSFGDPRVISRSTGQVFGSVEALLEANDNDGPATELLHFAIHSPRSPYGVPRWVGTLLSVLGSRQMEEVNYLYFENKSVPPLALLVSGGRLSDASVPRIERFIEENLKGKTNFHKILILEAEGSGGTDGRAKIELRRLTDAQQQDALSRSLRRATQGDEAAALRAAIAGLDIDWHGSTPAQRRELISQAMNTVGRHTALIPSRIETRFGDAADEVVAATRSHARRAQGLAIGADFNALDRRVTEHLVSSNLSFVTNEYGRRIDGLGEQARREGRHFKTLGEWPTRA